MMAVDQQEPGITDVHSASSGTASDGIGLQHLVIFPTWFHIHATVLNLQSPETLPCLLTTKPNHVRKTPAFLHPQCENQFVELPSTSL